MSSTTIDSVLIFLSSGWCFIIIGAAIIRSFCCYEGWRTSSIEDEEETTSERYRTMSSTRRHEKYDNLRKTALLRYLHRFTLTLGDEHLICCSESQTDTTLSTSMSEVKDWSVTPDESREDMERSCDPEEGNSDVLDMAQAQGSTSSAATHISLSLPGYDVTGMAICSVEVEAAHESRIRQEGKGKRWKLPSQIQSEYDDTSQIQTEPVSATGNPISQLKSVDKRSVPIFCAICLSEYDKGDRICWSSNAECSHVFHEDYILQWLISSGKKSSMNQYFYYTRNPTDEELLKDKFCPCCRQDFICVKAAPHGSEVNV